MLSNLPRSRSLVGVHRASRALSSLIVKSPLSMPELDGVQEATPKFVMKAFMNSSQVDLDALVDGHTGATRTYGELFSHTYSLAHRLRQELSLEKGDVVAIMSPNNINYFSCFNGIALTGAASTTINPLYGVEEVSYQLDLTKAKAIIAHPLCLPVAHKASNGKIPVLNIDSSIQTEESSSMVVDDLITEPLANIDIDSYLHSSSYNEEDLVTVPFSSGTTGRAKGVMLTHRNLTSNIKQIIPLEGKYLKAEHSKSGERGVLLCPLPFFHIYGMIAGMATPLEAGAKLIFMSQFDLTLFLELIQQHKVSRGHVVPPIVLALAKHPIIDNYRLDSLECLMSGAAPLGGNVQEQASLRLNCLIKQAWGMTELSPAGTVTQDELVGEINAKNLEQIQGFSGILVPGTEGKIVDTETGEDMDYKEEGELCIRGPQVMKGYLYNEEATNNTITSDGWLKTGDIGCFDDRGLLMITDRSKELIKYKGFQVPPAELEALLLSHDHIKDCVVIPVLDDEAGELPRAYVVKQDNVPDSFSEEDVIDYVASKVAPHKKLRGGVRFAEEIPKSPSGKLLRRIQVAMDRGQM